MITWPYDCSFFRFSALQLKPYNETALGMFLANDFNGDGIITLLELEASFDKYDANRVFKILLQNGFSTYYIF